MLQVVPADIELPPLPTRSDRVDDLDDEALDQLPYGVVGLDVDGRVRRYNLAEARLARLDRQGVLGEGFFTRVAPCTATPEFEGRVRAFLRSADAETRFAYVFDFRFGAQEVEVELARGGQRAAVYLLINRRRFIPQRQKDQARAPAITLTELRPGEAARGVRRPAAATPEAATSAQRQATVPATFFAALMRTWERVAPEGGPLFSLAWGESWGRLAMVELDTLALEREGKSLRELPTRTALGLVSAELKDRGLGEVVVDFDSAKDGVVVVHIERSLVAEAAGLSTLPRCALLAGFLQATFSHLGQKKLHVREGCCASQGHDRCSFFVVGDVRRPRLIELVHKKNVTALRDAADVVTCLVAP